jgi:hypothetical protein
MKGHNNIRPVWGEPVTLLGYLVQIKNSAWKAVADALQSGDAAEPER